MPEERVIPNDANVAVAGYSILIEEQELDDTYQVMSVSVHLEVNRLASATLIIRDGDPAAENFPASEADKFAPGNAIVIKVGHDNNFKTVFQGLIVRHSIKAKGALQTALIVECKHKAVKMTLGRKNKYFDNQKDSDVIDAILGAYSLNGTVESTVVTHKEIVQHHLSDWDFMLQRAEHNGRLVFPDNDKIAVKKPDTGSSPVLDLTYGANLLEIEAEMDVRAQWKNVRASSWDYTAQELAVGEAGSAAGFAEPGNTSGSSLAEKIAPPDFELRHSGHLVVEELNEWAKAAMLKSRMAKICGRAKITGFPDVFPGNTVQLNGCGRRFNGKVYITGVRHELSQGAWETHLQFGLRPDWFSHQPDIAAPAAGGLLGAVHGLQIGVAVQLGEDPDGEDRILVKIPTIDNNARGIWSRICTLDAGKERGTLFRPEIGDEVIVGFLNDDPRDAVVLGMLHSSQKNAWEKAQDDNHIKGYWSRSKMKWVFDDNKKSITMETPGGNKIILSDDEKSIKLQDQHGNIILMNDAGIKITSIKDIVMEASANVNIKAGANLAMEGTANAELKAGAQLTAKGTAGAEFSAGGTTMLKGALVQIN